MMSDAMRAADILDRVQSLYRRDTPQRQAVDLNETIEQMRPFTSRCRASTPRLHVRRRLPGFVRI
jgi:hypothetical protein